MIFDKYFKENYMAELALLKPQLKRLKLSGILETLDYHIQKALNEKISYTDFLLNLLLEESERRDHKVLTGRLKKSGLDPCCTLENFDFRFNTQISEPLIKELATCHFLKKKENIFFLGPSGVGKSFLAQAIAHEAIRKGCEAIYRNTIFLLRSLNASRGDGKYNSRLKSLCNIDLLILDDFGLHELNQQQQEDLYEIISGRYCRASTIITSNRDLSEWPSLFSNPLMGSAAIDRLIDGAIKIVIEGNSYRMNNFMIKNKLKNLTS
jgi:DNA replication protein DnaC